MTSHDFRDVIKKKSCHMIFRDNEEETTKTLIPSYDLNDDERQRQRRKSRHIDIQWRKENWQIVTPTSSDAKTKKKSSHINTSGAKNED